MSSGVSTIQPHQKRIQESSSCCDIWHTRGMQITRFVIAMLSIGAALIGHQYGLNTILTVPVGGFGIVLLALQASLDGNEKRNQILPSSRAPSFSTSSPSKISPKSQTPSDKSSATKPTNSSIPANSLPPSITGQTRPQLPLHINLPISNPPSHRDSDPHSSSPANSPANASSTQTATKPPDRDTPTVREKTKRRIGDAIKNGDIELLGKILDKRNFEPSTIIDEATSNNLLHLAATLVLSQPNNPLIKKSYKFLCTLDKNGEAASHKNAYALTPESILAKADHKMPPQNSQPLHRRRASSLSRLQSTS